MYSRFILLVLSVISTLHEFVVSEDDRRIGPGKGSCYFSANFTTLIFTRNRENEKAKTKGQA